MGCARGKRKMVSRMSSKLSFVGLTLLLLVGCHGLSSCGPSEVCVSSARHVLNIFDYPLRLEAHVEYRGEYPEDLLVGWEQLNGPGLATFVPQAAAVSTVAFTHVGQYSLLFSATDGRNSAATEVKVSVRNPEPTYFVSLDGSDRNDGRSEDSPFRTISRAARAVEPGDVVWIRGGVYHEYSRANAWRTSGEQGRPIIFMSYPGELAVISGSETERDPDSRNPSAPELVRLVDLDWYVFENLVFRHSAGRGLALEGNYHIVRNVSSHGHHGDGIFIRGDHNLIEDSEVFDNYSRSNGGDDADGIKIEEGHENVIRRVLAYENSDDGFDLWGSTDTIIEYSVAHNNGRGDTGNGNGFKLSSRRIDSGNIVRFNVAYQNRAHNFTDNDGGGLIVYNNTSWAASEYGFVIRGRDDRDVSEVLNNISYQDRDGVLIDVESGGEEPHSENNTWDLDIDDPLFQSLEPGDPGFL